MTKHSAPKRKKILFMRGFQLRYAGLMAGTLLVLLLFAGVHGLYLLQEVLPSDILLNQSGIIKASTLRLFAVGALYIIVVTLAAIFLSHKLVGPTHRIEQEIRKAADEGDFTPIKIRDGDEFENLVEAINALVAKALKSTKKG